MLLEKRMGELYGVEQKIYGENVEGQQNDELLIALDAMFAMTTDLTTAEPLT